jgi:hypothetical protein
VFQTLRPEPHRAHRVSPIRTVARQCGLAQRIPWGREDDVMRLMGRGGSPIREVRCRCIY